MQGQESHHILKQIKAIEKIYIRVLLIVYNFLRYGFYSRFTPCTCAHCNIQMPTRILTRENQKYIFCYLVLLGNFNVRAMESFGNSNGRSCTNPENPNSIECKKFSQTAGFEPAQSVDMPTTNRATTHQSQRRLNIFVSQIYDHRYLPF